MKLKHLFCHLCVSVLCLSSQSIVAQQLKPYESLTYLSPESYVKQFERNFDNRGIITQKKEYHALTISFFGIMCYDAFRATGDSAYYRHLKNQYSYFQDTSMIMTMDGGNTVGLPYRFNYKGLKAPWFSGMTQGAAASYLLRYYQLTGDRSALDMCQKVIRFQLKPESEGGTIGRTKEGGPWIEEYPAYKSSKSVLNGFINGLIGLKEYCDFFPEDKYARQMHDSCYHEMISNIQQYDTPSWTTYNRNGGAITNSYMRYELEEFDHLYTLYGDERLRRQMKIWARFAVGKYDKEWKFLIKHNYDFAIEHAFDPGQSGFTYDCTDDFGNGLTTFPLIREGRTYRVNVAQKSNYAEIRTTASRFNKKVSVQAIANGKKITVHATVNDTMLVIQTEKPFDELRLSHARKVGKLQVFAYDYQRYALPQFGFVRLSPSTYMTKGQQCVLSCKQQHLTNAVVFFRCGETADAAAKKTFRHTQSFLLDEGRFTVPETGTYELFISYDITHPVSQLKDLQLQLTD